MQKTSVELPQSAKIIIALAIALPAAAAIIFTIKQWYPATYAINYMSDTGGTFPLKATILINWGALMLAELVLLMPVIFIKKIFLKKKANKYNSCN